MVTYKYSAISRSGKRVNGVVEAFNEMDAVDRIKRDCPVVLKISEVKSGNGEGILNMEIGGAKLNGKAFTVMCSQFAIILGAGIPIARAVQLIADKTTDKPLKKMLVGVASDVEGGRSLAASFAERGEKLLPTTFIETIRAGEESGSIERSFASMHEHYDKQTKMKQKVKSAMAYPMFVLVIAIVVVIVLMVWVVPVFMQMFEEYDTELPVLTQILIAISNFFRDNILIIIAVIAAAIVGYKLYANTEKGRLKLAQLQRKLPILGNISQLSSASEFANSMATLLGSGLPMTKAVSITAKTLENYYVSTEVGKLAGKLEEGHALGASMREAAIMPDILTDMVAVGEATGEMEETLSTIGKYYDEEVEVATASALAKLEPALLIGLVGIAGFIVLAVYLAIFDLYGAM